MEELFDIDLQPDFDALGRLRDYLQHLLAGADRSLRAFYVPGTGGFAHRLDPTNPHGATEWSKASTATCVALLCATGRLADEPWAPERDRLINSILFESKWDSAGLGKNNAFAISFLLEALHHLGGEPVLPEGGRAIVDEKLAKLVRTVHAGDPEQAGGVALQDYESTAFLTYKAVSALKRWGRLDDVRDLVERWNWNHLYKECVLVASASADADVFEVAYSVLIASAVAKLDEMTPQHRSLLRFAADQFFAAQRTDGTWPRSRPLFVYLKLGHAYCYDYELLAALLSDEQLRSLTSERLGRLRNAAQALDSRKYRLHASAGESDEAPYGWSSGHHGTNAAAESWATAAALHFCFVLGQLVAEKIRRDTFLYVGAAYEAPRPAATKGALPDSFLDSLVRSTGDLTLKQALDKRFIGPLLAVRDDLDRGKQLRKKTDEGLRVPTSAILYGPPGTSKSQLAKMLAEVLGWPLLPLDPSHLTRRGLDAVHSEASVLFGMLQRCEQVVVLLDEFDELVREREGGSEMESRFLTTAMLPKLTALSDERRIVYLVGTNHVEQFDAAIRRPGRFDLIIPVMPPTTSEKERWWPELHRAIEAIADDDRPAARANLADLIFLEAKDLDEEVRLVDDSAQLANLLAAAAERCTMHQPVDPKKPEPTWKARMVEQESRIRGI
jgi:hypothetical protein